MRDKAYHVALRRTAAGSDRSGLPTHAVDGPACMPPDHIIPRDLIASPATTGVEARQ